eukprot:470817-Pyramimonas_sp.AAC.1
MGLRIRRSFERARQRSRTTPILFPAVFGREPVWPGPRQARPSPASTTPPGLGPPLLAGRAGWRRPQWLGRTTAAPRRAMAAGAALR